MRQTEIMIALRKLRSQVEAHRGSKISMSRLMEAISSEEVAQLAAAMVPQDAAGEPPLRDCCININGWTTRMGGDRYYRMYKTINGKTESIYLGKRLNWDKAKRKIAAKEKKLHW